MSEEPAHIDTVGAMTAIGETLDALVVDIDAIKSREAEHSEQITEVLGGIVTKLEEHEAIVRAGSWAADTPEEFSDWVAWIAKTYYLPPFDLSNTAVHAELTALRAAHRVAYSPKAGPWDQLTWHSCLSQTVTRIEQHTKNAAKLEGVEDLLIPTARRPTGAAATPISG